MDKVWSVRCAFWRSAVSAGEQANERCVCLCIDTTMENCRRHKTIRVRFVRAALQFGCECMCVCCGHSDCIRTFSSAFCAIITEWWSNNFILSNVLKKHWPPPLPPLLLLLLLLMPRKYWLIAWHGHTNSSPPHPHRVWWRQRHAKTQRSINLWINSQ